jgi:hypothetical protein
MDGFIALRGSIEQLNAVKEDDEYRRMTVAASLIVEDFQQLEGSTGEGLARDIEMYREAVAKVPQTA